MLIRGKSGQSQIVRLLNHFDNSNGGLLFLLWSAGLLVQILGRDKAETLELTARRNGTHRDEPGGDALTELVPRRWSSPPGERHGS